MKYKLTQEIHNSQENSHYFKLSPKDIWLHERQANVHSMLPQIGYFYT